MKNLPTTKLIFLIPSGFSMANHYNFIRCHFQYLSENDFKSNDLQMSSRQIILESGKKWKKVNIAQLMQLQSGDAAVTCALPPVFGEVAWISYHNQRSHIGNQNLVFKDKLFMITFIPCITFSCLKTEI